MRPVIFFLAASLLAASAPAFAESPDPVAPVKEVMDVTVANWSDNVEEWKSIFEGDRLNRLYTKEIVDLYKKASEKAAKVFESDEPVDPFDYDVVTNSQDGCPLQDVKISLVGEKDGIADVLATFKLWTCEDNADTKNTVSEVHFDVVTEDGRAVIKDIHHIVDGERDSVVDEMQSILKAE